MGNSDHYITKCEKCGIVMGQCRCMAINKEVEFGICDACRSGKSSIPAPSPVEEMERLLARKAIELLSHTKFSIDFMTKDQSPMVKTLLWAAISKQAKKYQLEVAHDN